LRSALVNAGFKHIHIEISGSNLLARASCVEIPSSIEVDSLKLGAEYLTKLLADVNDPMLRRGCIFRTFAYLVNLGSYVEAAGLYDELLNSLEAPNLRAVYSYEMFSTYYAIYSGPAYYYIGIFLLNHVGDYSGASMAFSHSEFLLRTKIRVAPQSSVLEESLLPLARFHNAVAQSYTSSSAPPFFTVMKLYARQALQVLSPQTIAFLRRARMFFQSFRNKEPNT
jgi:hypothetical protein